MNKIILNLYYNTHKRVEDRIIWILQLVIMGRARFWLCHLLSSISFLPSTVYPVLFRKHEVAKTPPPSMTISKDKKGNHSFCLILQMGHSCPNLTPLHLFIASSTLILWILLSKHSILSLQIECRTRYLTMLWIITSWALGWTDAHPTGIPSGPFAAHFAIFRRLPIVAPPP